MDDKELQQIAEMFDTIISSPSRAVQDAFRSLTVLAALGKSEHAETGPFEKLFERLENLEYQMRELRKDVQIQQASTYDFNVSDSTMQMDWTNQINQIGGSADVITISDGRGSLIDISSLDLNLSSDKIKF
jgi:predicted acyl esterase